MKRRDNIGETIIVQKIDGKGLAQMSIKHFIQRDKEKKGVLSKNDAKGLMQALKAVPLCGSQDFNNFMNAHVYMEETFHEVKAIYLHIERRCERLFYLSKLIGIFPVLEGVKILLDKIPKIITKKQENDIREELANKGLTEEDIKRYFEDNPLAILTSKKIYFYGGEVDERGHYNNWAIRHIIEVMDDIMPVEICETIEDKNRRMYLSNDYKKNMKLLIGEIKGCIGRIKGIKIAVDELSRYMDIEYNRYFNFWLKEIKEKLVIYNNNLSRCLKTKMYSEKERDFEKSKRFFKDKLFIDYDSISANEEFKSHVRERFAEIFGDRWWEQK